MSFSSTVSYNTESLLTKKRVLFEPVSTTDTVKAGYLVAYNHDRTTDLDGNTVAEGSQNPARSLQVEKPTTANVKFLAGVVCPESDGAGYGDWINIYLLNGADVPIYTSLNCTNGTTALFVEDTYIADGTEAGAVQVGLAKETVNRSVTNGLVLAKTVPYTVVPAA